MRVKDITMVEEDDEEVLQDAMTDEFASAFTGETCPKVLFTTCARPKCHVSLFLISSVNSYLAIFPFNMYNNNRAVANCFIHDTIS